MDNDLHEEALEIAGTFGSFGFKVHEVRPLARRLAVLIKGMNHRIESLVLKNAKLADRVRELEERLHGLQSIRWTTDAATPTATSNNAGNTLLDWV